jgi:hypothetical protein
MSTTSRSTPPERELPPAVRNGLLRADQLPPVQPLPDDPATRDARYLELAAMLKHQAENPQDDEVDWDARELFPPDRVR